MVQEFQTWSQVSNAQVPAGKGREAEIVAVAKRRQFSTAYKRCAVTVEGGDCDRHSAAWSAVAAENHPITLGPGEIAAPAGSFKVGDPR